MNDDTVLVNILGWLATLLSSLSLLPQIWKTWKTRSAQDLSLLWLVISLVASVSWLLYGVLLPAPAVIWANVFGGGMLLTLLVMKWQFG